MATQEKVPVHVVQVGTDRLSTQVAPLVHALGRALTASGMNRFRYRPMDTDRDVDYVHVVTCIAELASALTTLTGLVIVAGHGGHDGGDDHEGSDPEWTLWRTPKGGYVATMSDLGAAIPARAITADLLIIAACNAHRTRTIWRSLLKQEAVLLTANGYTDLARTSQWYAGLMSAAANQPGRSAPTKEQWVSAFEAARDGIRISETAGGLRPTKHELPSDTLILTP